MKKNDRFKNKPDNSSTAKVSEHIPSSFSMSTISIEVMIAQIRFVNY